MRGCHRSSSLWAFAERLLALGAVYCRGYVHAAVPGEMPWRQFATTILRDRLVSRSPVKRRSSDRFSFLFFSIRLEIIVSALI